MRAYVPYVSHRLGGSEGRAAHSYSNDSPSPRPSPAGRGGIIVRMLVMANGYLGSWVQPANSFEEILQGFRRFAPRPPAASPTAEAGYFP
jgi:hypothetical protein